MSPPVSDSKPKTKETLTCLIKKLKKAKEWVLALNAKHKSTEPSAVTQEPTAVTPEPSAVAQEPTAVIPEPSLVTPESSPVTPEPTAVMTESTTVSSSVTFDSYTLADPRNDP